MSDAPTAVVGDSLEERQETVTTPSTPREGRPSEEQPGGSRHMDPPLHCQIPKKRTSGSATNRDANIYDLGVIYTIYSPRLRLYDPHMIFYDFPRFYVNKIKCVQFVLHVVS